MEYEKICCIFVKQKQINMRVNLVKEDVVNVLLQVGKDRPEILDDLKSVVRIRVSEYMRLV